MTGLIARVHTVRGLGMIAVVGATLLLSAAPAAAQDKSKGEKTAAYWNKVRDICTDGQPKDSATIDAKVAALRSIARRIDDLSARGVDTEVVEATERVSKLMRRTGDYLNDYGDASRGFASGFRDGLNNNPTRAIDELQAIQTEMKDLESTLSKVRKRMESKYDLDFADLK